MVYLESFAGSATAPLTHEVDERAARRTLRTQIARLERDLASAVLAAYPHLPAGTAGVPAPVRACSGSASSSAIRDDLAGRVAGVREQAARQGERQAERRLLIERMLLDPGAYRWVRVSNADIGEPGCKNWHVVPRLGIVGMLAGWWHVKISSGCPLAT